MATESSLLNGQTGAALRRKLFDGKPHGQADCILNPFAMGCRGISAKRSSGGPFQIFWSPLFRPLPMRPQMHFPMQMPMQMQMQMPMSMPMPMAMPMPMSTPMQFQMQMTKPVMSMPMMRSAPMSMPMTPPSMQVQMRPNPPAMRMSMPM